MKKKLRKYLLLLIAAILCFPTTVWGIAGTDPYVPYFLAADRTVTNVTSNFSVYSEGLNSKVIRNSCLYVKNGTRTLAKKKYSISGNYNIRIPRQKAGDTLTIFFKNGRRKSDVITLKVKDIHSIVRAKYTSRLKAPMVKKSSSWGKYLISGYKGTDVIIQTDTRRLKKIHFSQNGRKWVTLDAEYDLCTKYVYTLKNGRRSKIRVIPELICVPD